MTRATQASTTADDDMTDEQLEQEAGEVERIFSK